MNKFFNLLSNIIVDISQFIISILICLGAGGIGSFFTTPKISSWYAALEKPFFNPPNWVFGPVWTILYILMGISLYLVWKQKETKPRIKWALFVFAIQLILNVMWALVFFALESPLIALIVIILLWISIGVTIYLFYFISCWSSYLLVPYFLWVSFAIILNIAIVILN